MITISIYCKKEHVIEKARTALEREFKEELTLSVLGEIASIEFNLHYEMPHFVLYDLDDPELTAPEIIAEMAQDPWLSSIGILGICKNPEFFMESINGVFSFLQPAQLDNLLPNIIRVLISNTQLMIPRNLIQNMGQKGSFKIENKPETLEAYAELMASTLYNQNLIDYQGKYGLKFSLIEMLMNAVEHGNCNISHSEKKEWLEAGHSMIQLIERKYQDPDIAKKRVTLDYEIGHEASTFMIMDEGKGFDTSKLPVQEDVNLLDLHGRGVFMTRHYVAQLFYNDIGNQVTIKIAHQMNPERSVPQGFQESQILSYGQGDVVFQENDRSDILYYIISGDFEVVLNGRVVNTLNSTHVFLGEMAFLLGNRRTATVRAKTEGRLVAVRAKEWINAVQKYPYYGIFLSRLLARKLNNQTQSLIANETG